MKKLILAIVLLQATLAMAQKVVDTSRTVIKAIPTLQSPGKTKTPRSITTPANQTPPATATAPNSRDFHLTSAKATIYTGNDNKEKPSRVQMQLSLGTEGVCNYMIPAERLSEFAVNSATELPFACFYDRNYYYEKLSLANVEAGGLKFWIHYTPNFFLDAWKIEKVILTVEFRDGNGNLHPTMGTKSIQFMNVNVLLKEGQGSLVCEVDRFMMPVQAYTIK